MNEEVCEDGWVNIILYNLSHFKTTEYFFQWNLTYVQLVIVNNIRCIIAIIIIVLTKSTEVSFSLYHRGGKQVNFSPDGMRLAYERLWKVPGALQSRREAYILCQILTDISITLL